jgi:hypothetical protein
MRKSSQLTTTTAGMGMSEKRSIRSDRPLEEKEVTDSKSDPGSAVVQLSDKKRCRVSVVKQICQQISDLSHFSLCHRKKVSVVILLYDMKTDAQ